MPVSPFPYTDCGKRYYTYDFYLRRRFGGKAAKLPLDGGYTCPNRDGSKGVGGCAFCSDSGSGDFCFSGLSITEQMRAAAGRIAGKWESPFYIAYFQAHTGTYAPLSLLRAQHEEALRFPRTVGIAVATRPDCLTEDICDYLAALSKRTFLTVELGLQTIHEDTARRMNRCHSYAEFLTGFSMLRARGIPICVHLINGLPGETAERMLESARAVAALRPEFVKLHLLQILRGTPLAEMYEKGELAPLTLSEYVKIVADEIECFPPETVFARLTADSPGEALLAPLWCRKKLCVLNEIDKELRCRGSVQGVGFRGSAPDPGQGSF